MTDASCPPATSSRATWRSIGLAVTAAIAFTLGIAFILGIVAPRPAFAQDAQPQQARIWVTDFTGILGPGTRTPLENDTFDPQEVPDTKTTLELRALVENVTESNLRSVRLLVEVYPAVTSRQAFRDAMEGHFSAPPLLVDDPPLVNEPLTPGRLIGVHRQYDEELIGWSDTPAVHPVRIAAVRGTTVLDEVVTAAVWLPDRSFEPMNTVLVWPIDDPPWRGVGGAYPSQVDEALLPGGRIDALVRVLEQRPTAPIVLAAAPHLLEDLRDRANGFTVLEPDGESVDQRREVMPESIEARRSNELLRRIRELAEDLPHAPIAGAYAGADLSALYATGELRSRDLASEAAVIGRLRLQLELGRIPAGATYLLDGPIDPSVLDLLPGDQLVVPPTAVVDPDEIATEPIRALRSPAGRTLSALIADPALSELTTDLAHPAGPILGVQRLIAGSALLHFERPTTEGRGLLLLPGADWDPGIEAGIQLIDQLDEAPWLNLTDMNTALTSGRRGSAPVELAPPEEGTFPSVYASRLADALSELAAARSMLPPQEATLGDRSPSELHDALIRSTSRALSASSQRAQLVTDVRHTIEEFTGQVVVSESSVTLTSDSGQIPVTVQRTLGGPIIVRIEVASGGQLLWPDGRTSEPLVLEEDASLTVSFSTEALSSGTHPVRVTVMDPTGERELYQTLISVRSHAISGPALAGIGAVVVVLLLIGALRRRRDHPALQVVADDPNDPMHDRDPDRGRRMPTNRRY